MANMTLADEPSSDEPLLVHAVSWAGREPHLVVSNPLRAERDSLPLVGQRLTFEVDASGRYCTGRFVALSAGDGRHEPCDGSRLATSGKQCERCAASDDSRFMHHAHRGGFVPESLNRYLAQPHWLYLATFADGAHKIGTASDLRKQIRLDEQGAVRATYVAHTPDGRTVRVLEDAVTQHLGVSQTRHRSSKTASLARPLDGDTLDAIHAGRVADVEAFLRGFSPRHAGASGANGAIEPSAGVSFPHERWVPPTLHDAFFAQPGVHPPYPHALTEGTHCLTPLALVGGVALVAVNRDAAVGATSTNDLMLVDLGHLAGRRITFADVRSPSTTAQHSLF